MIPRGKLDITYADVFAGFGFCLLDYLKPTKFSKSNVLARNLLPCLSVRSGFDLVLRSLNLPPGSEVLVTDISIPGMFQILEAHQIIAIPLPINKHSLAISAADFSAAITEKSKAVIFTHLFGATMELTELVAIAKSWGLLVIEDCAQAYTNNDFAGTAGSDIRMFSFGMIKTNTALSGALLHICDLEFYQRVATLQEALPEQRRSIFLKKLFFAFAIKLLTTPVIYLLFYRLILALRKDPDDVLSGFTRGFPGASILMKIRFKPSLIIKQMIARKIENFSQRSIDSRREFALGVMARIPALMKIGSENMHHSFWVLPIEAKNPLALIQLLRSAGFDATMKASSLVKMKSSNPGKPNELTLQNLIYLPMWPNMSKKRRRNLGEILNEASSD